VLKEEEQIKGHENTNEAKKRAKSAKPEMNRYSHGAPLQRYHNEKSDPD